MQQPLELPTKNATIFWEHEVFVDCFHSNTAIYIFSVFFSKKAQKSVTITQKNISFNLGFFNKYLFCHPYVTVPSMWA